MRREKSTQGLSRAAHRAAFRLLELIAPQRCLYCQQRTYASQALCDQCALALTPNIDGCPRCALPACQGQLCPDCLQTPGPISRVYAPYVYDPAISYFMHCWKYQGNAHLSRTVSNMLLNAPIIPKDVDLLLAIPLHWRRQLSRGFNQSQDLLDALCRQAPQLACARSRRLRLRRLRFTPAQAQARRRERMQNLHKAFAIDGDVTGRSVVLIDDVCTTGATANAVARTLRRAGARDVQLWCLARTPAP